MHPAVQNAQPGQGTGVYTPPDSGDDRNRRNRSVDREITTQAGSKGLPESWIGRWGGRKPSWRRVLLSLWEPLLRSELFDEGGWKSRQTIGRKKKEQTKVSKVSVESREEIVSACVLFFTILICEDGSER